MMFSSSFAAWTTRILQRFRGDIILTVGAFLTALVAFSGNLVATRCLSPGELGVLNTLLLIPTYCMFLQMGVFNGLNRNIAFFKARGDHERVQAMVNSSWWAAKLVSAVGLLISLALGMYYWLWGYASLYLWGMAFLLLTLVAEPLSQHLEVVYLSSRSFQALGVRLLWQNLFTFLANLLPALAGPLGFIAARVVYVLSRLAFRWFGVPIKASGDWSFKDARDLAVTGMPLLLSGTLYAFLAVSDRTVIAWFLTPKDMGHFSLAGLVVMSIQFVPQFLASLLYPRVAAAYGRTSSSRQLRSHFWILLGSSFGAVLPMATVAYFLVGPLTRHFFPEYVEGIPAAKIACISSFTFIYIGVGSVIAVVRRNTPFISALLATLLTTWLLGAYLIQHGYGIVGAVWARTVATGGLCLFTIGYAYWLTCRDIVPDADIIGRCQRILGKNPATMTARVKSQV
jgi:O-antigen/teichoic acid export membrane protein